MPDWWRGHPEESFWCEITDRPDVGADLKCPQANEAGDPYWSYSLINEVKPGDVVFHYSTRKKVKAFVGASVASAPLEERPIVWIPHGTVGRSKRSIREPRPGWWRPLYHFTRAQAPLKLAELQAPEEQEWIRAWISEHQQGPFQPYPRQLRASQGYLTKMPLAFVERWSELSDVVERLTDFREELSRIAYFEAALPRASAPGQAGFQAKSDEDYKAFIRGSIQIRSRSHEKLVNTAANWLQEKGATVSNPHPIDLMMTLPQKIILEAKVVGENNPIFAVREAVGQLHEYRYFLDFRDFRMCILLNAAPDTFLMTYIEEELGMLVLWSHHEQFMQGPRTAEFFHAMFDKQSA